MLLQKETENKSPGSHTACMRGTLRVFVFPEQKTSGVSFDKKTALKIKVHFPRQKLRKSCLYFVIRIS